MHSCEKREKRKRCDVTDCNPQDTLMLLKQLAIEPFNFKLRMQPQVNQLLHVRGNMLQTNSQRKRKHQQSTEPGINGDSGMSSRKNGFRGQERVKGYIDVSSLAPCMCKIEVHAKEALDNIPRQKPGNTETCNRVDHPSSEVPSLARKFSSENSEMEIDWDSAIYKDPQQCHIPVGPDFQANIPEWTGFMRYDIGCSNVDNAGDSRWLGTQVWPIVGKTSNVLLEDIGKGRSENCSCRSPGSVQCVNQHVLEQRFKLESELGLAFHNWRIDYMGEAITKSWTAKEHKPFNALVKKSMSPRGVDFWNHAPKYFPGKSDKDLQHYFLNVYIPRRIGLQTRLSLKSTDTDDSDNGEDDVDSIFSVVGKANNTVVKQSRYLRAVQ